MTGQPGNGHFDPADDDGLDDDAPLDAAEEAAAAAEALAEADETLDERVEGVVEVLDGVGAPARWRRGDVPGPGCGLRGARCRTPWRSRWTRPSRRPR